MRTRIAAGMLSVFLLPPAGLAQSAFEVVAVKRNTTGNTAWSITYTADSLHATNATLAALIQSAYGILLEDRLVGGPSWVRTSRFDVNAKALVLNERSESKGAETLTREKLRLMAQRLLEDRFGIALKRERRKRDVYELRLARTDGRTGPDLRRATEHCLEIPPPRATPRSSTGVAPTTWGWCTTIDLIATGLSRSLRVAVVDQTGLPGRWDFVLAYAGLAADASPAAAPVSNLPTVFVAVQEQLGLKLERNPRGSVEYVVIVSANQPTEN